MQDRLHLQKMRRFPWFGIGLLFFLLAGAGWGQLEGARKAKAAVLLTDAVDGYVIGDRGIIVVEEPKGIWRSQEAPVKSLLTGVALNEGTPWVVGHDKTILKREAGQWRTLAYDTGNREDIEVRWTLLDIHWFSAEEGMIVGSYGLVMRTSDGGKTWSENRIEWTGFDPELDINEMHLYKLRSSANGTVFCAADDGSILRSRDRGKTWDRPDTGEYGAFFDVMPVDDKVIVAVGILGTMIRSVDGGETWSRVETGTRSILHALHLKDGELWALGSGGTRLRSTDKGASFTPENTKDRVAITGVASDGRMLTEKGFRPW